MKKTSRNKSGMTLTQEQKQALKDIIDTTIARLYERDGDLIQREGLERSIAFRMAVYLNNLFVNSDWLRGLDFDMEYNKNGLNTKRIPRRPNGVQPDIILHRRRSNEENVLVVEIKGWWNNASRDDDRIKLEDFTHQDGEYKYGLGVFLDFGKEACAKQYFINGVLEQLK
jgi:hypothetical protein